MLGAEGLDADLGLVGVLAHAAEDEVAEGLDAVLGLEGVPAQCNAKDDGLKKHLLKIFTFEEGNLAHVCSSELLREEVV